MRHWHEGYNSGTQKRLTVVTAMPDVIKIQGPVELVDGNLTLRIPLSFGGAELAPLAGGIGEVKGDHLCVTIQPWLAEKLRIGVGSLVVVDNYTNGTLTITRGAENHSGDSSA